MDISKPLIQTDSYTMNKDNDYIHHQNNNSDGSNRNIPIINEKVKLIKLGPLQFKKNRITKSLNKL
mgnify:CR=1 FL=1